MNVFVLSIIVVYYCIPNLKNEFPKNMCEYVCKCTIHCWKNVCMIFINAEVQLPMLSVILRSNRNKIYFFVYGNRRYFK